MANFIYNAAKVSLGKEEIDWENDTIKVAMLTSSYTPDIDNDVYFSDVTNEVSGSGYTAGGFTLANTSITQDDTNDRAVYDADDLAESPVSISSYRYLVVYVSTGTDSTSRLICLIDLGTDQTVDNDILEISWGSSGIFYLM